MIREARSEDASGILGCLAAAFAPYRNRYTPEAFEDTVLNHDGVQRRMREMLILVAVADGRIVGTIGGAADGAEGHLRGMAALPEWQGTGVASALLAAIEAHLEKSGCAAVTLDTTEPLERAIRFYLRNGYSPTGRVSSFFGMQLFEYSKKLSTQ